MPPPLPSAISTIKSNTHSTPETSSIPANTFKVGWPVRTPRRCVQRTRDDSHSLVWADRPWSADPTTQASIALTADADHRPYQSLSFVLFIKAASEMPPLPKLLTSNPHPCVSGLLSFKPQHRYGRPSLVVLGLFQTEKNVKQTLNSPA